MKCQYIHRFRAILQTIR